MFVLGDLKEHKSVKSYCFLLVTFSIYLIHFAGVSFIYTNPLGPTQIEKQYK